MNQKNLKKDRVSLRATYTSALLYLTVMFEVRCLNDQLIAASLNGNAQKVEECLNRGACVDFQDTYGNTALCHATCRGDEITFNVLIARGADVNVTCNIDLSPLIWTCIRGHFDMANLLLEAQANVRTRSCIGLSALTYASISDHLDLVQLLLEKGAEVHALDITGKGALEYASTLNHTSIFKFLLLFKSVTTTAISLEQCIEYETMITAHRKYHIAHNIQKNNLSEVVKAVKAFLFGESIQFQEFCLYRVVMEMKKHRSNDCMKSTLITGECLLDEIPIYDLVDICLSY